MGQQQLILMFQNNGFPLCEMPRPSIQRWDITENNYAHKHLEEWGKGGIKRLK